MKGLLVVTDAIEGVHLIDLTNIPDEESWESLGGLAVSILSSHAGGVPFVSYQPDVRADVLPRAIRVWPDLDSFFGQFGISIGPSDEDDT
jgi:hypothetical protein